MNESTPINPSGEAVGMFQRLMKLEDKAQSKHLDFSERTERYRMRRWMLDYLLANVRGDVTFSVDKT